MTGSGTLSSRKSPEDPTNAPLLYESSREYGRIFGTQDHILPPMEEGLALDGLNRASDASAGKQILPPGTEDGYDAPSASALSLPRPPNAIQLSEDSEEEEPLVELQEIGSSCSPSHVCYPGADLVAGTSSFDAIPIPQPEHRQPPLEAAIVIVDMVPIPFEEDADGVGRVSQRVLALVQTCPPVAGVEAEEEGRCLFHPIGLESDLERLRENSFVEEEDAVEELINSLLATLSTSEQRDIFNATAIPESQVSTSLRRQCSTALDLQSVIEEDPPEPDPRMELAIRSFQQNRRTPKGVPASEMIRYLSRQRVTAILCGDYDKAKECDDTARLVAGSETQASNQRRRTERAHEIEGRLNSARHEYRDVHVDHLCKLKQTEADLRKRVSDLDLAHRNQLQAFERKWNSEDFLRRYTKPSPLLQQMKAMEKSMVMSRMFEQAKLLRRSAQSAEKVVTSDRQEAARQEMQLDKQRLLDRQTREMEVLKAKCNHLYEIAQNQIEQDERPTLSHIANLEKTLQGLRGTAELDSLRTAAKAVTQGSAALATELASARTVRRFSAYKSTAQNVKLKIQPMGSVASRPRSKNVCVASSSAPKNPKQQLFT
jgi:hypothetical protein